MLLNQLEAGEVLGDEFSVEQELEATQAGGLIEMNQPTSPADPVMPEESAEPEDQLEIPS
jgi:hypothetical protein